MSTTRREGRAERIECGLAWLSRYDDILDDPQAFRDALEPPHPVDLHVLGGPDSMPRVAAQLAARGLSARALPWAPRHLRIDGPVDVEGSIPEVAFGLAYRQGAVSALPCEALAPRPGERVIDLCAAPGGKTIYLARLSEDRARLLAGDPSEQRAGLVVQSLARAGVTSCLVVHQDGTTFPAAASFDAILIDAPCTGEGTFRVASPRFEPSRQENHERTWRTQRRLLDRAWELLAPGGRIVYSTCSYAPEENEAIVSAFLGDHADADLDSLPGDWPAAPGLTSWQGQAFDPRLERARRLYPHRTGSWGFFVSRLRKSPDAAPVTPVWIKRGYEPQPLSDDTDLREDVETFLAGVFGVDARHAAEFAIREHGRDLWFASRIEGEDVDVSRLRIVAGGLRSLRRARQGFRITNSLARRLGHLATRRVIDLDWNELLEFLAAGTRPAPRDVPPGQVILRCEGTGVACAYARGETLELELPKAWR